MILNIDQNDLDDAISDTSIDGGYIVFYEQLQESLSQFSERRIKDMKGTLEFVGEIKDVNSLSLMDIIYEYSKLI